MSKLIKLCILPLIVITVSTARAGDAFSIKNIGLDLAQDIAAAAVDECRKQGYQVSVVVVGRNGLVRVAMRDDLAPRFTLQISEEKANLAVMAGTSSGDFRNRRDDIRAEMNHLDDIIVMEGALEIIAGGARLGAIGVSGAPGGDIDEACAQKALDKYADRLEFLE
ncbi:MAG: heme-binding protein [Gammaproteobacteria bacterium]|nr:heme-binding protein [Gammaproteobacteria bacterium]